MYYDDAIEDMFMPTDEEEDYERDYNEHYRWKSPEERKRIYNSRREMTQETRSNRIIAIRNDLATDGIELQYFGKGKHKQHKATMIRKELIILLKYDLSYRIVTTANREINKDGVVH